MNFDWEAGAIQPFLKVLGIWPEPSRYQTVFFISHLIIQIIIGITFFMGILAEISMSKAVDKTLGLVGLLVPLTNLCIFKMKSSGIKSIIYTIRSNWDEYQSLPCDVKAIMGKNGILARRTSTFIFSSFAIALICFCLQPLIFHWASPSQFPLKIPDDPWYPYHITDPFIFAMTYVGQITLYCSGALVYSTIDCCIIWLIVHCYGQLEVLGAMVYKYTGIVHHISNSCDPDEITEKSCSCLSCIVNFQLDIARTVKLFNDSFHIMMLARMILCCAHFICIGYIIIQLKHEGNFGFLIIHLWFLVTVNASFVVYCYIGDRLKEKSMDIAHVAFHRQAFEKPQISRDLMMIIRHLQMRPTQISAAKFFVLSLELFKEYILKSVSYLSVLAAVTMKQHD